MQENRKGPVWIWYPGDFELYHGMRQNFSRVERGFGWPAFWKSEGFRNRIVFRRAYELPGEACFETYSSAVGYVLVQEISQERERKFPLGTKVTCGPGQHPSGKNRDFSQCICKGRGDLF